MEAEQIPSRDDHEARSRFVRKLVQQPGKPRSASTTGATGPRKTIVQFWHDLEQIPEDVLKCIESWRQLEKGEFKLLLFDDSEARKFISEKLGPRCERAYAQCYHPAMQSDYFRLCYLVAEGGCYVDADDEYLGRPIEYLFTDGHLAIQPLCYDIASNQMVPPSVFTNAGADAPTWIFYFNNNPLVADRGHPIIERALANATEALEAASCGPLPEIQSTTGPGNLTMSIVELAKGQPQIADTLVVLRDWEDFAVAKWPLSYRSDTRNWRLSNQSRYRGPSRRCAEGDK